ncbi:putative ribonuclease H-like domain-containing protein [Tanacetum coccineum]
MSEAEPIPPASSVTTLLDDWSIEIDADHVDLGQDGLGVFDWSEEADNAPIALALMATSSTDSSNSKVPYCSKCSKSYKKLLENYQTERDNFQRARSEILGYQMSLESLEVMLKTHEKNEYAWGDKYEQMEYDLKIRDLKLEEKQKELDQVLKERDDFKVKLEKWTNASVLQNEVLNKQRYLSDKSCIGFGVESSSGMESDNSSGDETLTDHLYENFKREKAYKAVPPPTARWTLEKASASWEAPHAYPFYLLSIFSLLPQGQINSGSSIACTRFSGFWKIHGSKLWKNKAMPTISKDGLQSSLHKSNWVKLDGSQKKATVGYLLQQDFRVYNRNAFEEEKRRIALENGKESANSTLTLSTANTPSQSTGNTPTDSDDDVPKDGVFSTNSFDDENTDNEEDGAPDYNKKRHKKKHYNILYRLKAYYTKVYRSYKWYQSQVIGKSTAGVLTRRKLKESASDQHQALLSFICKQNRTNHKDQQTCLFVCFLSQEEPKKVSQALADESWVEAIQEEGVDYDEVFAPISRIKAIKLFLAIASLSWAFYCYRNGVKSAFCICQHPTEEVYVKQLQVLKICSSKTRSTEVGQGTYGVHQAPRAVKTKYVKEILNKFDFRTIKPASTPIEAHKSLGKDEEDEDVDVHLYRSMIGCLMYLTASRPDIMFAVCSVCKVQVHSKVLTHGAVKSSLVTMLGTIMRYDQLQEDVNTRGRILNYGFNFMNTEIHIDNESTICIVRNPVLHSKTKHIQIRHHFIRDCYEQRLINVSRRDPHKRVKGRTTCKVLRNHSELNLLFDDADGVDCFPKQVIWDSLRDIGYEGNLTQLTFSKPLFSPQWKYLVIVLYGGGALSIVRRVTSWEQFGTNIASALALETAHEEGSLLESSSRMGMQKKREKDGRLKKPKSKTIIKELQLLHKNGIK